MNTTNTMKLSVLRTKIFLILLLACTFSVSVEAQTRVSGTVSEVLDNQPLTGANIVLKGSSIGTISDIDGKFTLNIPATNKKPVLVISYLGYARQEIPVGTKTTFNIVLSEDVNMLDEVVAVGYGHLKRVDLTGAVSSLSTRDVEGRAATSYEDLLRGRIAGVNITSSDGAPGAGVSIKIRGGTSINASSEPLYVIDGFPMVYSSQDNSINALGGGGAGTNPLADLNPEDIESIDILKDASATAIYGSRGANGVILITTKKAEGGKSKITYRGYYGVQIRPKEVDLFNSREYSYFENERLHRYPSKDIAGSNIYNADAWAAYQNGLTLLDETDWSKLPDTNWQREIYRLGYSTKHQLNITGGNDRTKYIYNVDFYNVAGVVRSTDFSRLNSRIGVEHTVSKWLSFSSNNNFSYSVNNGITQASGVAENSGIFLKAIRYSPLKDIYSTDVIIDDEAEDDLDATESRSPENPLNLLRSVTREKISWQITSNNTATFKILKGLELKSSFAGKVSGVKQNIFYPSTTGQGRGVNGRGRIGSIDQYNLLNENILTYTKHTGKHDLNLMGGLTFQFNHRESYEANGQNFVYQTMGANNIGIGTDFVAPGSYAADWAIMSYLGRANYNYDNRYLLTASIRADGSSRFDPSGRWGYFPSVAGAWRISEEDFVNRNIFSNLKLRSSYGQTGNQEISLYKSLRTYNINSVSFGSDLYRGFYLNNVGNEHLTWETTNQWDLGLDAGFFDNRLNFNLDYYYKITSDLLLDVPTLPSSTFKTMLQNIGKVRNQGVELTLGATILKANEKKKKPGWNVDFNIARNLNTVLSLGSTNEFFRSVSYKNVAKDQVLVRVGEPLGSWYGYKTDGIFQYNDPDLDRFISVQGNTPAAGDWKYVDLNNDNVIDENDRTILGNSQPDFYGGFSTTFSYRRFELRVLFDYSHGAEIFNANRIEGEDTAGGNNRMQTACNRWTGPDWQQDAAGQVILENGLPIAIPGTGNPSNTIPRAGYASTYQLQDNFIEDGSYVRLSNIKLSYYFTGKTCRKLHINGGTIYCSASNLFLWTKYTGSDPEVNINPNGAGYNNIMSGYDYDSYPRTKTILFGINFNF